MHNRRGHFGRQLRYHQHDIFDYFIDVQRYNVAYLRGRHCNRGGCARSRVSAVHHHQFVVVGQKAAYVIFKPFGSERAYAEIIVFRHIVHQMHVYVAAAEIEAHTRYNTVERKRRDVCKTVAYIHAEYGRGLAERHVVPEYCGKWRLGEVNFAYVAIVGKAEVLLFELGLCAAGKHENDLGTPCAAGRNFYFAQKVR